MRRNDEPKDWREGRRLRAWELKQQGWSQKAIAEALGATEGAVSQWMKRAAEGGKESLKRQPPPGRLPRLSEEQRAQLPDLLAKGAEHYGFLGEVWTQDRVRALIQRVFGVSYHRDHIGRLLKTINWSVQKPTERATQRDDEAIARWKAEKWSEIKKKQKRRDGRSST
jgi:transposase